MKKDLKDKVIAVIGVSDNPEKYGYRIFKDLLGAGYKVAGVNPKGGEVLNENIYKSLSEIENRPDLVITVVPPKITEGIVDECRSLGIHEIWMQPGSESDAAVRKAEGAGMAVTRNACIMVRNGIW